MQYYCVQCIGMVQLCLSSLVTNIQFANTRRTDSLRLYESSRWDIYIHSCLSKKHLFESCHTRYFVVNSGAVSPLRPACTNHVACRLLLCTQSSICLTYRCSTELVYCCCNVVADAQRSQIGQCRETMSHARSNLFRGSSHYNAHAASP